MVFGKFGMFGITWLTFLFAALLFYVSYCRLTKNQFSLLGLLKYSFPLSKWKSPSSRIDIFMYIVSKFIGGVFTVVNFSVSVIVAKLISHLIGVAFPGHAVIELNVITIIIWSVVFFIIVDFSNYLTHYLQHVVPVLWELHKVHHTATFLTPLTTKRMHPLGDQFDNFVAALLVGVPLGVCQSLNGLSVVEMLLMLANANMIGTIIVLDPLRHSHFPVGFGPLDKILISPHMHQLHHSYKPEHWDKNFGNKLSVWDWWFATVVRPRKGEEFPLGLGKAEEEEYHTILGVYLLPLIKIMRLLRGTPASGDRYKGEILNTPFLERVFGRKPPHIPTQPFQN